MKIDVDRRYGSRVNLTQLNFIGGMNRLPLVIFYTDANRYCHLLAAINEF